MKSTGEDSLFVHQNSLAIPPAASSSGKSGGPGEGNLEFGLTKSLCSYFEGIFNMPFDLKTLGRRLDFPSEEGVLRIFITLKSPLPSVGFEPVNTIEDDKTYEKGVTTSCRKLQNVKSLNF
jgi:hypothetical protein